MSNENNVKNMGTETTTTSKVQLADGTVLNCQLNGTEYETEEVIADDVLSIENLSNVTINGEAQGSMKLIHKYAFQSGTRFALQPHTREEDEIATLKAQIEYIAMMANIDL